MADLKSTRIFGLLKVLGDADIKGEIREKGERVYSPNNRNITTSVASTSTTLFASASAVKQAYDRGSSAIDTANTKLASNANAVSATKLVTARTINGSAFNGTANITTASWGTARSITIGSTTRSVNGGGNVSWSQADFGYTPEDVYSKLNARLQLEAGGLTAFNKQALFRQFNMLENASTQYILLCENKGYNDVVGKITMSRTSGNWQSCNLDVIVSSTTSAVMGAMLSGQQILQSDEQYKLVKVTYAGNSWIAIKYTGSGWPMTTGAFFTGYLNSTNEALSLTVVSSVTSETSYVSNGKHVIEANEVEINGSTVWHEGNQGAGSNLDAGKLASHLPSVSGNAHTVVVRTSAADINARLFRSSYPAQATMSGALAFRVSHGADNYIRFCSSTPAIREWLDVASASEVLSSVVKNYYTPNNVTVNLSHALKHVITRWGDTDATVTLTGTALPGTEVIINNIRDDSGSCTITGKTMFTGNGTENSTTHTMTGQGSVNFTSYDGNSLMLVYAIKGKVAQ